MTKKRKRQDDRYLKWLSRPERRKQESIRKRVAADPIITAS